jgi:hypothetical protein
MSRPLVHRLATLLLLSSTAGCVLVEPAASGPLEALRRQQRAQAARVAEPLCAAYYACDCQDPYPEHVTEAECVEKVSTELVARLEQGIDGDLDYDPACLDLHAELLEGLGCASASEILLDVKLARLHDAAGRCRTYHGAVEEGEECDTLVTARGDDCEPDHGCNDFAMCISTVPLAEGAPCSPDDPPGCVAGTWCEESWTTGASTCVRPPSVGESCQAGSGPCDFDSWCDTTDFTCRRWSLEGEPCRDADAGEDTCDYHSHCQTGVCVAAPVAGEPCGLGCALGHACGEAGLCVRSRALVCDMQANLP